MGILKPYNLKSNVHGGIFANYLDIPTISIATAVAFDPIETHTTFGMGKHLV